MRLFRPVLAIAVAGLLIGSVPLAAQKKKKDEKEITQTLEVIPELPATVQADATRLAYFNAPLSGKGLLSQQVRDGVKALWRVSRGAQIIRIRAFVAGTGDMRRVADIISEMFTEKRQPLPVANVVQVGVLPLDGAQVVLEATALAKKVQNPHGVAFISGQGSTGPIDANSADMFVAPLAQQSVANLNTALTHVGLTAADVLRVTCLSSSLDDYQEVRRIVASAFPASALNIVQVQRAPTSHVVECEAVARLKRKPEPSVQFIQPPGLTASPNFTHVVLVGQPKLIFTTTQLGFRQQDDDVRLAFSRLASSLEAAGGSMKQVVFSNIYPISPTIQQKVRNLRFEYYDRARPPASTVLLFEGLPSLDASFGVDVISLSTR
jgi:enamine deaminase RidA (YjgF/YER057c/UK114 family)